MTTDILTLDSNWNSIITQEKKRLDNTIYKNSKVFKHNDIIFLPSITEINKILVNISKFPLRYKNIEGTKRFKEIKDYILIYNLLQQYLSPHSEDKSLIALDSRYISKALGSRFHNNKNKFFKSYFDLKIKGIKGRFTSGFSLKEEAKKNVGTYAKVIHKEKLDNIVKLILLGEYNEDLIVNVNTEYTLENIKEAIFNSSIKIPKENIMLVNEFTDDKYSHIIKNINNNYKNGRLYYNKNHKPYGRNYSYIHTLPREIRNALFNGFTELDLSSAAQTILLRTVQRELPYELPYITEYVNNKDEVRKKLCLELEISMNEVKELIQIVTFNTRVPKEKQVHFFKSFKKYKQSINNPFIKGLSKDLSIIDEHLTEKLSNENRKTIQDFKGRVTKIDIRVHTFQSIESKIMERIQLMLSSESFHLHDAVYVKDIEGDELDNIKKYTQKNGLLLNNITLVSKKYTQENGLLLGNITLVSKKYKKYKQKLNENEVSREKILQAFSSSKIKIKSQEKLEVYIDYCVQNNEENSDTYTEKHHILPKGLFPEYYSFKKNPWNLVNLNYTKHIKAHILFIDVLVDKDHRFNYGYSLVRMTKTKLEEIQNLSDKDFQKLGKLREEYITSLKENWHNIHTKKPIKKRSNKRRKTATLISEKYDLYHLEHGLIQENMQVKDVRIFVKRLNSKENYTHKGFTTQNKELIPYGKLYVIKRKDNSDIEGLFEGDIEWLRQKLFNIVKDDIIDVYEIKNDNIKFEHSIKTHNKRELRDMIGHSRICDFTKENPMGSTKSGKTKLINNNREHLIGVYVHTSKITIGEYLQWQEKE